MFLREFLREFIPVVIAPNVGGRYGGHSVVVVSGRWPEADGRHCVAWSVSIIPTMIHEAAMRRPRLPYASLNTLMFIQVCLLLIKNKRKLDADM